MPLKTTVWPVPREPGDGLRVLITRYRPRALPKAKETWDVWMRALGPSGELFDAFFGKKGKTPITLAEYHARYREEMKAAEPRKLILGLAERLSRGEDVTLLCSKDCILPAVCHRTVLAEIVETSLRDAAFSFAARGGE
jgi:uncharacterized protein YeaO (DUF488 family)